MSQADQEGSELSYDYESLLDEHFQRLAQALLIKDFPDLQCLPVGMPDGGRDALASDGSISGSIVFQVKFSRNPDKVDDPYKWITSAIDGELLKVEKLANRGATSYVLVTNLPGTSHLDVGLIDKTQKYMDRVVPIPARCMWRDDLDRRLDSSYDLKLRYPFLLSGPDAVRKIWEETLERGAGKKIARSLQAYLRQQYDLDETVRFKQVELLTTNIFDLFIDVPVVAGSRGSKRQHDRLSYELYKSAQRLPARKVTRSDPGILAAIDNEVVDYDFDPEFGFWYGYRPIGAANLLTDEIFTRAYPFVVVEGAPGQGKSTLSQYLVQVQRARYLNFAEDLLSKVNQWHLDGPVAFPIKIELRDLAQWLNGIDPWNSQPDALHGQPRTLEAALAAHVARYSGGTRFEVDDLLSVIGSSATVIVLDALDEVADLTDRSKVVAEVTDAIARLRNPAVRIMIVITSRPTALSNAPAFDRDKFAYLTLESISPRLSLEYTENWSKARRLNERDAVELASVLAQKIEAPHMAELARNTMQLTILLSLILTHGTSLPDKRTQLYTSYLDRFISRESEKSPAVRDNRELLLDLHGYLGYYLHARAEGSDSKDSNGRIRIDELRAVLISYLEREGREPGLVDSLFNAVVTRVVALVPRVEGTFEFEVQPLREYFAARYLHETAPYSPVGQERCGTKPDRFAGVAPNPYWMNVSRFFAGFFSKGELLDLAQIVCDLILLPENRRNTYPRSLAVALLQDWVFSQSPRATELVTRAALGGIGLRWAALSHQNGSPVMTDGRVGLFLSKEAGGKIAAEMIWEQIVGNLFKPWTLSMCRLMAGVESQDETAARWKAHLNQLDKAVLPRWVQVGAALNVLSFIDNTTIRMITSPSQGEMEQRRILSHFVGHERVLELSESTDLARAYLNSVCDRRNGYPPLRPGDNVFGDLMLLSSPVVWAGQFAGDQSYARHIIIGYQGNPLASDSRSALDPHIGNKIAILFAALDSGEAQRSLEPWEQCIGFLEELCGRVTWRTLELSVAAAGVRSSSERGQGASGLFDSAASGPRRVRMARRKAKQADWWSSQRQDAVSPEDELLWLLTAAIWTSSATFVKLIPELDSLLQKLSEVEFDNYLGAIQRSFGYSARVKEKLDSSYLKMLKGASSRTMQVCFRRLGVEQRNQLVESRLLDFLTDRSVAHDCVVYILNRYLQASPRQQPKLRRMLEMCVSLGVDIHANRVQIQQFPAVVGNIVDYSGDMPSALIELAIASGASRAPDPVVVIAKRENWFTQG
jgi:hypothetical protein